MIRSLLAATAVMSLSAAAVQAQTPAPAAPQGGPADVGLLPGAELSPDCGGLNNLTGRAWCVTAQLGQIGALADAYIADLAHRLSRIYATQLEAQRKTDRDEAYAKANKQTEPSPLYISPGLSGYYRS